MDFFMLLSIILLVNNCESFQRINGVCDRKRVVRLETKLVNITKLIPGKRIHWYSRHKENDTISYSTKNMTYTIEEYQDICCSGYLYNNITKSCKLECKPNCINANCIENNQCVCHKNYIKSNREPHVCNWHCPCENGNCLKNGTCTCLQGYFKNPRNISQCIPTCSNKCINGYCSSPNFCTCRSGFKKNEYYSNVCEPICNKNCGINSQCTAPNICMCKDGYVYDFKNGCSPSCNFCKNGTCIAPNVCKCLKKYELDRYGNCIPKCENGYRRITNDTCLPVCFKTCINGWCKYPNFCECFSGYSKDHRIKHKCNLNCEKRCQNGICLHNECTCRNGFRRIIKSPYNFVCVPNCTKPCVNGECTSPNQCTCFVGYKKKDSFNCIPKCHKPCINGHCSNPDYCECNQGFRNTSLGCVPHCSDHCINSICVAPERCDCLSGYVRDISDTYRCNPICTSSCINGNCTFNDTCVCGTGYTLLGRECLPNCKNCTNGYCDSSNTCVCNREYTIDSNLNCILYCVDNCKIDSLNNSSDNSCWNILYGSITIVMICIVIILFLLFRKYCRVEMEQNTSSWKFLREFKGYGNVLQRDVMVQNNQLFQNRVSVEVVSISEEEDRKDYGPGYFFQNPYYIKNLLKSSHIYENGDDFKLLEKDEDIFLNPIYNDPFPNSAELNCDNDDDNDYAFIN